MKKIIFILFILLLISGCESSPTGKGVIDPEFNEKIGECVRLCDDGSQSEEAFRNSCSKILEFGGEETFNDYLEQCR